MARPFAEFEQALILGRQREGIAAAHNAASRGRLEYAGYLPQDGESAGQQSVRRLSMAASR